MEQVFLYIWRNQNWGSSETVSGHGSTFAQTGMLRAALPGLFKKLGTKVLLDIACGEYNWMSAIRPSVDSYIGADIVPGLIDENQIRHGDRQTQFICLDITRDLLPNADVAFCRDCLVHLSFRDIGKTLKNLKRSKIEYVVTTTFPATTANSDIVTGDWRPLNVEAAPLRFPKPIKIISEGTKSYGEKCMGVWRTSDLSVREGEHLTSTLTRWQAAGSQ